ERRLRPAFLRQGRLARRHGRERRPHEPLAMRYQLKAIGPGGGVESSDSQAPDETTAVRQLEGRGYTVLSVRAKHTLGTPWGARSRRFPVALFSQELRVLINAGLPLVEAIDTLGQKERSNEWRGLIERLVTVLREGQPLSAALEQFPQAFSPLYIATVKASEKTSDLAPALARYVAYAGQLESIRKRVVNASIYPMILIAVGSMVGLLLRGGMPLVAALDMGAELLHPMLRARLAAASRAISEGRNVSQSMDANGLTTPVALRMLAVGEKGGNMGEMLEQIAAFHDEELA